MSEAGLSGCTKCQRVYHGDKDVTDELKGAFSVTRYFVCPKCENVGVINE